MTFKEVRLGWEESQKHYLAIDEIEGRHLPDNVKDKMKKNQVKKAEVKIHNETNDYLRRNELIMKNGGFYKTVMVSDD